MGPRAQTTLCARSARRSPCKRTSSRDTKNDRRERPELFAVLPPQRSDMRRSESDRSHARRPAAVCRARNARSSHPWLWSASEPRLAASAELCVDECDVAALHKSLHEPRRERERGEEAEHHRGVCIENPRHVSWVEPRSCDERPDDKKKQRDEKDPQQNVHRDSSTGAK
eukprot:Amastigsp_a428_37.p3 type:complete len:170 gc:universal Amastigsp_a428_37:526-17(-)